MRSWDAFQEDQELVLEKLQEGAVDHLEVISRVMESGGDIRADLFQFQKFYHLPEAGMAGCGSPRAG